MYGSACSRPLGAKAGAEAGAEAGLGLGFFLDEEPEFFLLVVCFLLDPDDLALDVDAIMFRF